MVSRLRSHAVGGAKTWGACFGHYGHRSAVKKPTPVSRAHFEQLAAQPLGHSFEARRLVDAAAGCCPSLRPVTRALEERRVGIALGPSESLPALESSATGFWLRLPEQRPVAHYLGWFFSLIASIASLPVGACMPVIRSGGGLEATYQNLLAAFWRRAAYGLTFLFAVAHDYAVAGCNADQSGVTPDLLGTADRALFRAFRHGGVPALVEALPHFMSAGARLAVERQATAQASFLTAALTVDDGIDAWAPTGATGTMPQFPRGPLDDLADAIAPFSLGCLRACDAVAPLAPNRRTAVLTFLDRQLEGEAHVWSLLDLMDELAPALAAVILKPYREGRLRVHVVDRTPNAVGQLLFAGEHGCWPSNKTQFDFFLPRGSLLGTLLIDVVRSVAFTAAPAEAFLSARLPAPVLNHLVVSTYAARVDDVYRRGRAWAESAALAFCKVLKRNAIPVQRAPHAVEMEALLTAGGIDALQHRWYDFTSAKEQTYFRRRFSDTAARVIQARQVPRR